MSFCFANLNEPVRKAYPKQALRMLRNRYWADTLEGHLLKNKYPVVFSNHVDPFAGSNLAYSLPLIKAMVKMSRLKAMVKISLFKAIVDISVPKAIVKISVI